MALLLRLNKAAPLTNAEVDDNFLYLEGLCVALDSGKLSTASLLTQIRAIDGIGSQIDADRLHGMTPTDQAVNSSIVNRDSSGNFSAGVISANLNGNAASASTAATLSATLAINKGGTNATSFEHTNGYTKFDGSKLVTTETIPGSSISGNIPGSAANVTGIVDVANGGTGANTEAGARAALGLVPGQTIQGYASNLQNLSGLALNGFVARTPSGLFTARTFTVGNCLSVTNPTGENGNPTISLTVVDVAHGGTGATSANAARAALGAAAANNAVLSGTPLAPTAPFGTKNTQIATTEFCVQNGTPTGTIIYFAGLTAPAGYLLADNAAYAITAYPELYAVLSTRFGTNGPETFRVPSNSAPAGLITAIKT